MSKETTSPYGPSMKLRYRCYDALGARPEEEDEFEYTLTTEIPGRWFSFDLPENINLELPTQQDSVVGSGHDPPTSEEKETNYRRRLRRSKRSKAYAARISEYAQHKRILKQLHKYSPARVTRRRKSGEIVLKSNGALLKNYKGMPRSVKEAMAGERSQEWMKAKQAEDDSLNENETWE